MNTKTNGPRFSLFNELDRGLNHLVNEVLHQDSRSSHGPELTVYEFDDRYEVECDLPGVLLEDVTLQLEDGVLSLDGVRNAPSDVDVKMTVNERKFGEFHRKLRLGKQLDVSNVDAEIGNGVLRVTIPKVPEIVPKAIKIRSTDSDSGKNSNDE